MNVKTSDNETWIRGTARGMVTSDVSKPPPPSTPLVPVEWCSSLTEFKDVYATYHKYNALIICSVGSLLNLVNIIVLTRKEMNSSPINRILTGIYGCTGLRKGEYLHTRIMIKTSSLILCFI